MGKQRFVSRETTLGAQTSRRGLAPGTLLDEGGGSPAKLRLLRYRPEAYEQEAAPSFSQAAHLCKAKAGTVWLHCSGTPNRAQLEELGQQFGIHPLTLEDIQGGFHQAKLETFEHYVYLQCQNLGAQEERVEVVPFHILLKEGLVISILASEEDITAPLLDRLQNPQSRLRQRDAGYLVYALLDLVVDQAFPALQYFTQQIEALEEDLLTRVHNGQILAIQQAKRDLIVFNHVLWPMQEAVSRLNHSIGEHPLLCDNLRPFLNDLYDHTIQLMSLLTSERDVVSGLMDIYLSMVNNRLSDIMRVLTIISTIFIPLTFVTGIYGMNIDGIPLLHYHYGYDIVVAFMTIVALSMLWYFRRRGWIFQHRGRA